MIALTYLDKNKIVYADAACDYRISVLHKRYPPREAWDFVEKAWDHRSPSKQAKFLAVLQAAGGVGGGTRHLNEKEMIQRIAECVRWEKIVVFMEWLSPCDLPVKADSHSDRWWLLPKEQYQQTAMRKRALPKDVRMLLDQWFPVEAYDQAETGPRLAGLKLHNWQKSAAPGRVFDYRSTTLGELVAWVKQAVAQGEVVAFEELHRFTTRLKDELTGPLTAAAYLAAAKTYAEKYEINLGQEKSADSLVPITKSDPSAPQTYKTPTTDKPEALPNETDDTCPSHNCRSESTETADPACEQCFDSKDAYLDRGDKTLGKEGGGGFLASTTRVVELPEPKKLWRYCGGASGDNGSWWSLTPFEGDPRVENALFPAGPDTIGGTGEKLVACEIKKPTKVLMGIGAPRCSNKPGGPVQVYFKYGTLSDPDSGVTLVK